MTVLYAAPYSPGPPGLGPVSPWGAMSHTWTGWDGSVWDLSRPSEGVFLAPQGLEGLHMPDFVNYTSESPIVHGSQWSGWHASGRKVYWNVHVYGDRKLGSAAWVERNRAFWKTMRPGKTGVWTVGLPTGEKFSLRLRLQGPGGTSFDRDPVQHGWKLYGIELFPEQPFWEGSPVIRFWDSGKQVPFLGPDGFGPPFFVSPAATIGSASVTNPGDVETFIQWTILGETSSVRVGIGNSTTTVPFRVPDGEKLVINTDPRELTAVLNGRDVMPLIREFNYPALPPGEDIKLSLAMDGTGSVEARFTPYYFMGM